MTTSPPDLAAALAEKEAVLTRIKEHFGVWTRDRRMRIMGEMILRDIERFEREEAEKTRRGDRAR